MRFSDQSLLFSISQQFYAAGVSGDGEDQLDEADVSFVATYPPLSGYVYEHSVVSLNMLLKACGPNLIELELGKSVFISDGTNTGKNFHDYTNNPRISIFL